MKLDRIILISLLLLVIHSSAIAQETWKGDGNWWRAQDRHQKETYLVGVMDGLLLQEVFVLRSYLDRESDSAIAVQRRNESMAASKRFLSRLSSNQIIDELDAFYLDFRNRSIRLAYAMQIVIYQLNNEPNAVIQSLLESTRKAKD